MIAIAVLLTPEGLALADRLLEPDRLLGASPPWHRDPVSGERRGLVVAYAGRRCPTGVGLAIDMRNNTPSKGPDGKDWPPTGKPPAEVPSDLHTAWTWAAELVCRGAGSRVAVSTAGLLDVEDERLGGDHA